MRAFLVLLLLSLTLQAFGQKTKKVTVKSHFPPYKETYLVLKKDRDVKHGAYHKKYGDMTIDGQYDNNNKSRVWKYYDRHGELEQEIDFDRQEVVNSEPSKTIKRAWYSDDREVKELQPNEFPVFMGGDGGLIFYIQSMLRYPEDARRHGVQGQVLISATITTDGTMIDEKVKDEPGYGLGDESLRVVKMIPDDWIPSKINGKKTEVKILIPVNFRLG